jgi:gamma-glutamyl:cysteine ligase YbdK (ATP-grasp superfamily)
MAERDSRRRRRPRAREWRAYEVAGLESEYSIVDDRLAPHCGVAALFSAIAGHRASDVELGPVGLSNELAAHVLEMKTPPERSLVAAERRLADGVRRTSRVLRERFGWRLLPTGMHPLMSPADTSLWPHGNRRIYQTYARVFGIRSHGWLNVQSCQTNLPFGSPDEAVHMHNAAACLVAYLPALTASSPLVQGRRGPALSSRMVYYARNQLRVPEITAGVVPEFVDSLDDYRRRILGGVYAALRRKRGTELIRREWVNSRGAILRFDRRAMEVRVVDLQECPKMDVAVAAFVRSALAALAARLASGELALPARSALLADHRRAVRYGLDAPVSTRLASAKRAPRTARALLDDLLEDAARSMRADERRYLDLVARRIERGSLAEHILRRVDGVRGNGRRSDTIRGVYTELMDCLEANEPWSG